MQGLADEIDALRMIFMVNERAMFEFVVTEASLREVVNRTHPSYTQWVYDVLDTWLIQSEGEKPPTPGTTFEDRRFGMISVKDRRLLQEALDWRCDAFMTMERRLPTAAAFVKRETGLRVLRRPRMESAESLRPAVLLTAQRASCVVAANHSRRHVVRLRSAPAARRQMPGRLTL